jgi:hypothetical protein
MELDFTFSEVENLFLYNSGNFLSLQGDFGELRHENRIFTSY